MSLTETRLLQAIEAYGADTDRWPRELAAAAAPYLDAPSAEVARALETARALDAALMVLPEIEPPAQLSATILAGGPQGRKGAARTGMLARLLSPLGPRLGAAAASLALGLSIGFGTAAAGTQQDDPLEDVLYGFDIDSIAADYLEAGE